MNNCSCPCNSLIVWDESFFDAMPERKAEGLKSRKEKGERKMSEGMICNCKQVSYADVENALHQMTSFDDVLSAFDEVQKVTHCSTGCGGCHDKIMDAISEIMMG